MDKPKDLFKQEKWGEYIIIKRYDYTFDNYLWEISDVPIVNLFLRADKKTLVVLIPHTEDNSNFDWELYENEGHGSTWKVILEITIKELKEFVKGIKNV